MLPVVVRRDALLDSRLYPYPDVDMSRKEYDIVVFQSPFGSFQPFSSATTVQAYQILQAPLLEVVIPRPAAPSTEHSAGAEEVLGSQRLGIAFHVSPMVISYVAPWSPAQGKLQPGDHVVAIDDWRTHTALTAQSVLEALAKAPPSSEDPDHIHLLVARPMAEMRSNDSLVERRPDTDSVASGESSEDDAASVVSSLDIPEGYGEAIGFGYGSDGRRTVRMESSLL